MEGFQFHSKLLPTYPIPRQRMNSQSKTIMDGNIKLWPTSAYSQNMPVLGHSILGTLDEVLFSSCYLFEERME